MSYTKTLQRLLQDKILIETDLERYERFISEVIASEDYTYRTYYLHQDKVTGINLQVSCTQEANMPCFGWYAHQPSGKVKPLLRYFLNPQRYPEYTTGKILPFTAKRVLTTTKKKGILSSKNKKKDTTEGIAS